MYARYHARPRAARVHARHALKAPVQDDPPVVENAWQKPTGEYQGNGALAENDLSPKNRKVEGDQLDGARGGHPRHTSLKEVVSRRWQRRLTSK